MILSAEKWLTINNIIILCKYLYNGRGLENHINYQSIVKLILLTYVFQPTATVEFILFGTFLSVLVFGSEQEGSTVYILLAHTRMWHFMSLSRISVHRQFCISIYIISIGITSCVSHLIQQQISKTYTICTDPDSKHIPNTFIAQS